MKRTMVLFIVGIVFASALVAGLLFRGGNAGLVRSVQANEKEEGCTLETLQGEYLFTGAAQANINRRDDPTYPRVFAVWLPSTELEIFPASRPQAEAARSTDG